MSKETHLLTMYEMNETEEASAQLLPEANLKLIKNLLATDTLRLNNLVPDPESYHKFIQEHAEVKGAISAWRHLLTLHDETIKRLATD